MLRFGIIGFGLHAVKRLMPGFAKATNCTVTALSRRDPAKARASAAEYKIPHAFDSTTALCASPEVDAVLVASPDALHLRDVLTAIEHRKPVLCEKPMAMDAGECRQMVEAARAANVLLGVAHVFRFEESTTRLRQRLAAGDVGRPLLARAEFCYPGREHRRTWMTDPTLACGGPLADVGVHCIDALRYMLQDEITQVAALAVTDDHSGGVEAAATLQLKFARGTLGTVMVSARAQYRTPVEFVGESGVLRAHDCFTVERPVTLELQRNGSVVETEQASNQLAYARQVDAFAAAVEGRSRFPARAEDGWQNQEILDAAYRSVKSGKLEPVSNVEF
jgi:1,5-anhydro-D-fructose reductase (1,5-anhydro-D-mannitol-forming)